jgi:hypothetical protein
MVKAVLKSDLRPLGVRTVAIVMAFHASDDELVAWPSHATVARECGGMHRDTVRHAIKQLLAAGVFEVVGDKSEGGAHGATTRYRFAEAWFSQYLDDKDLSRMTVVLLTQGRATPGGTKNKSRTPGVERPTDPGSSDPAPGVERPPKSHERKTESSLSWKDARAAQSGQPAAGRPSAPPPSSAGASAKTKSKQPPSRGRAAVPPDRAWMESAESIQAKAAEFGIGPFDEATEPPGPSASAWGSYQLRVMRAAGVLKAQGGAAEKRATP